MRILYDGMIYLLQKTGGINRYFSNIISGLPFDFMPVVTIPERTSAILPIHRNMKVYPYKEFRFRPGRIARRLNKYYLRSVPLSSCPHVIHPTYYHLLSDHDMSTYRKPIVVTVWDMIHEIFPDTMDPERKNTRYKQKAISGAQAILCISENTKKDLLQMFSIPESKVFVTPLASQIDRSLSYGSEKIPERPYFLYVGSRYAYKNFNGMLGAFALVASANPDVIILVVGPPFDENEKQMISDLRIRDRIEHYGIVSDMHLAKLYRCSVAFLFPSLYEGFGIPLLEAMACGTPVVASNCSSFPEVVGNAGLLFDPKIKDELPDILLSLLKNPAERDRLIAKGYERAKEFSWEKTVAQTVAVYRSLV